MTFTPGRWAEAFVNTMGSDAEEALIIFKILRDWVNKLPGAVFGPSSSMQVKKIIGEAGARLGLSGSAPLEGASQFIMLMVMKNIMRGSGDIITETERLLDKNKNMITVVLEYVFPPDKELEESISEIIKKQTGADGIRFIKKHEPALIGGYRLKMGDMVTDASVLFQLSNMEAALALNVHAGL